MAPSPSPIKPSNAFNAIYEAARFEDEAMLVIAMGQGSIDEWKRGCYGLSAAAQWAFKGRGQRANFLIRHGANCHFVIYGLALAGNKKTLNLFLENKKSSSFWAVYGAAQGGHKDLVKQLLGRYSKMLPAAVQGAAARCDRPFLKELFQQGKNDKLLIDAVKAGARCGHVALVWELLQLPIMTTKESLYVQCIEAAVYGFAFFGDVTILNALFEEVKTGPAARVSLAKQVLLGLAQADQDLQQAEQWLEGCELQIALNDMFEGAILGGHQQLAEDLWRRGGQLNSEKYLKDFHLFLQFSLLAWVNGFEGALTEVSFLLQKVGHPHIYIEIPLKHGFKQRLILRKVFLEAARIKETIFARRALNILQQQFATMVAYKENPQQGCQELMNLLFPTDERIGELGVGSFSSSSNDCLGLVSQLTEEELTKKITFFAAAMAKRQRLEALKPTAIIAEKVMALKHLEQAVLDELLRKISLLTILKSWREQEKRGYYRALTIKRNIVDASKPSTQRLIDGTILEETKELKKSQDGFAGTSWSLFKKKQIKELPPPEYRDVLEVEVEVDVDDAHLKQTKTN